MLLHSSDASLQTHNQGLPHSINSMAALQSIKQEFLLELHSISISVYTTGTKVPIYREVRQKPSKWNFSPLEVTQLLQYICRRGRKEQARKYLGKGLKYT